MLQTGLLTELAYNCSSTDANQLVLTRPTIACPLEVENYPCRPTVQSFQRIEQSQHLSTTPTELGRTLPYGNMTLK